MLSPAFFLSHFFELQCINSRQSPNSAAPVCHLVLSHSQKRPLCLWHAHPGHNSTVPQTDSFGKGVLLRTVTPNRVFHFCTTQTNLGFLLKSWQSHICLRHGLPCLEPQVSSPYTQQRETQLYVDYSNYFFDTQTECTYAVKYAYYYQYCPTCFGAYCAIFREKFI